MTGELEESNISRSEGSPNAVIALNAMFEDGCTGEDDVFDILERYSTT